MKRTIGLLFISALLSCGVTKSAAPISTAILQSDCPKAGTCNVQFLKNKSMVLAFEDNHNSYTLIDNPEMNVIIFTYSKTVKGNLQDAGYREEVIFETSQTLSELNGNDADLQKVKMLFGRFCYCKGQTGYYKVSSGKMTVDPNNNLSLHFTVSEVPQIINEINLSLK